MSRIVASPPPADRSSPHGDGPGRRGFWFSDFRFRKGRVRVFDTGADLALDRTLIGEALVWFGYHLVVRVRSWLMLLARRDPPRVWFAPHRPRPWYLVWAAMAWSGVRMARAPEAADAAFAFEDATWSTAPRPPPVPAFNFDCADISKSRVAEVFEAVFGYPLALDPTTWSGPAVRKGEVNGAHDGQVVACPTPREPGWCYQRLIDTRDGDHAYDLRTACVGRRPVAVWIKRKPAADRFSIHNLAVTLHRPGAVFSPEELERIERFLAAMQLDWGGLDILRDAASGRIYVVDVNKTDVGPIIALSLADKIRSTVILARAFDALMPDRAARRRPTAAASGWGLEGVARLALVLGVIAMLAGLTDTAGPASWLHGLAAHSGQWRDLAMAHPGIGLPAFVLAYALAIVCFLPVALALTGVSGFLFGPVVGAAASVAGATLGAAISYGLARSVLSRWVERRLSGGRGDRLASLAAGFRRDIFRYVLALRLLPFTPFNVVSLVAGGVRAPLGPFLAATALGVLPECIAYAAAGRGLGKLVVQGAAIRLADLAAPGLLWPLAAIAGLALVAAWRARRPGTR